MTHRITKARRLEAAGYAHVSGWAPVEELRSIKQLIEAHRSRVEKIAETPPRGKPKKEELK